MRIQVVCARHPGCDKDFFFTVTEEQAQRIEAGDVLLVSTIRGEQIAVALQSPFTLEGDSAILLLMRAGAYLPLKPVITYCSGKMRAYILQNYLQNALQKEINDNDELPF